MIYSSAPNDPQRILIAIVRHQAQGKRTLFPSPQPHKSGKFGIREGFTASVCQTCHWYWTLNKRAILLLGKVKVKDKY